MVAITELTNQEFANRWQEINDSSIKYAREAVRRACNAAAEGAPVVPVLVNCSDALGLLWQVHARITAAADAMPDVAPAFGGKG